MRLADALILRADRQKRLAQLQARIVENARVQEGDNPAEDPNVLLNEFDEIAIELSGLVARINRTNLTIRIGSGQTITDAIALRDRYKVQAASRRAVADAAAGKQARVTRSEIKFVPVVNVGSLRKEADDLSKAHRELDSEIQAANWGNDLME